VVASWWPWICFSTLHGEWCNWQHSRFWFCYSGFDSLLPSSDDGRPSGRPSWYPRPCFQSGPLLGSVVRRSTARSSRGLGHHPLKVAARVRIPYGLPTAQIHIRVLSGSTCEPLRGRTIRCGTSSAPATESQPLDAESNLGTATVVREPITHAAVVADPSRRDDLNGTWPAARWGLRGRRW
jgi:hypothetical protein